MFKTPIENPQEPGPVTSFRQYTPARLVQRLRVRFSRHSSLLTPSSVNAVVLSALWHPSPYPLPQGKRGNKRNEAAKAKNAAVKRRLYHNFVARQRLLHTCPNILLDELADRLIRLRFQVRELDADDMRRAAHGVVAHVAVHQAFRLAACFE